MGLPRSQLFEGITLFKPISSQSVIEGEDVGEYMDQAQAREDLEWSEVWEMGKKYLRIPLALVIVEAFYWFIIQGEDTLAWIQVSEAWLWHVLTNLIHGDVSTLTMHDGWMTQVNLINPDFPGREDMISLYVSDECAGVHEMMFLTTLIVMTDGVSQKVKLKSIITMCGIVYVLNLTRLLLLYQYAAQGCADQPIAEGCAQSMWDFHNMVYEWGFLVVLVLMWLVWFKWTGADKAILENKSKGWGLGWRKDWDKVSVAVLAIGSLMLAGAVMSIVTDEGAMQAWDENQACQAWSDLDSEACASQEKAWKEQIKDKWAFAGLGLFMVCTSIVKLDKPNSVEEE